MNGKINDYRSRLAGSGENQVIALNKGGKSEHQREGILRNSESPNIFRGRKVSQKKYRPDIVGIRVKRWSKSPPFCSMENTSERGTFS